MASETSTCFFGLEVRREWADALITGHKKVEVRGYDLPAEFVGELGESGFGSDHASPSRF